MRVFLLLLLLPLVACNEDSDRYEKIDKLRTLGVAAAPTITKPSTATVPQVVTLTVHAALPLGATATAEPYVDSKNPFAIPIDLAIVPGSDAYEDHNAFRIYSVKATFAVPPIELMPIPPEPGFVRLRYGLRVASDDQEEKIVGSVLAYPDGAPETAWATPSIDVTEPAAGATVGDGQELKSTLVTPNDESLRVAWFVSDGKLKNRRAKETKWEEPGAGPQTLVLTARGLKSGAFALKVVDVNVE